MIGWSHQSSVRLPNKMPSRFIKAVRCFCGDKDNTEISPLVGRSIPERSFIVVLFPAPLGPAYATNSPFLIENVTSSSAVMVFFSGLMRFFISPFPVLSRCHCVKVLVAFFILTAKSVG